MWLLRITTFLSLGLVSTQPVSACGSFSEGIPGFVGAQRLDSPKPLYPSGARNDLSEGWVELEFSVSTDGRVRDISVVDAMGPKVFVQTAVQAISNWQYKPATRNGVPVSQHLCFGSIMFKMEGSGRTAEHEDFVYQYKKAARQIGDGRVDEAITSLEEALRKPQSNLYELASASFVLAYAYSAKGDIERALFHIEHALIDNMNYLGKRSRPHALELAVQLRAQSGDFRGARDAFKKLRELAPAAAAGRPAEIAARIDAALHAPEPLAVSVRLVKHPLFEAPGVWRHHLMRSKFSFAKIVGEVKSFRLACAGVLHEAAVDPEMEWDVPKKAGPCVLRVDGTPGATFMFVEE